MRNRFTLTFMGERFFMPAIKNTYFQYAAQAV